MSNSVKQTDVPESGLPVNQEDLIAEDILAEEKVESSNTGELTSEQKYRLEIINTYINLAKWVIISVVFGWVSLQFKQAIEDRQQGQNEIALYDDYLGYVLNSKLDQSYQLARYFSKVTASEDLRDGWIRYYDEIKPDYMIYKNKLDSASKPLDSLNTLLAKKGADSIKLQKEIVTASVQVVALDNKYNKILIEDPVSLADLSKITVYIQYSTNKEGAEMLSSMIKELGSNVPAIDKVEYAKVSNIEIRYFKLSDKINAMELKSRIKQKYPDYDFSIKPFLNSTNVKNGTIEIWLK